ncbi:MAG: tetratricopeptide repeat protein [Acidobacteriia bacterium]|nr:tetratricopeptide repeat protein [Terriglobia bacterium]
MSRHLPHPQPQPLPQAKPVGQWTTRGVILLALFAFMAGLAIGSLTRDASAPVLATAASANLPPGAVAPGESQPAASPEALQKMAAPLLAAVKADPKNRVALIQLGNFYYDHKQFQEAIENYRRVLEIDPKNMDVRTDLGTAYWYLGSAEKAIAEYDKALAIQPNYAPTMMNLGIIRQEGLKDIAGALSIWKKLLETNPNFSQRQRVLDLIVQAENGQT